MWYIFCIIGSLIVGLLIMSYMNQFGTYVLGKVVDKSFKTHTIFDQFNRRCGTKDDYFIHVTYCDKNGNKESIKVEVNRFCFDNLKEGDIFTIKL